MKIIILLVLSFLSLTTRAQVALDSLEQRALNNQNPERWNKELFEKDKERLSNNQSKPIHSLAFPVEDYEYYVFNKPFNFEIDGSHFSGISFGENIGGREGKWIFRYDLTLIFHTKDSIIELNADVSSRNFPSLTVQGQLRLNQTYDFVGVRNADESGMLLVSLKAFDLRNGSTVIIFPKADNSFYYLQSRESPNSGEKFEDFIDRIKRSHEIRSMLDLDKK